ncbi:MAG: glycosyltransferase [Cyanobacteria bacterium P01_A01_bin.40]
MPTISVIIPAYNAERTILETINSVRQQTIEDLEIIVINDGSHDRSLELLATVTDARLKVYSFPNAGLPTARNRGIARATGDYISFIDADDLWTTDKLEKQLAALQANPDADVAYSWIAVMLEARSDPTQISFFPGKKISFKGNVYRQLLISNFIANGSNILVTSSAVQSIDGFDPQFKSCEDWDYYLRLASQFRFVVVPEYQILYRKSANSMTSNGLKIEQEGLKVINQVFQTVPRSLQHLKQRSIANLYRYCGKIYIDRGVTPQDIRQSKSKLVQAISLSPVILLSVDTYVLLSKIMLKALLPDVIVKTVISTLKKPFAMKNF